MSKRYNAQAASARGERTIGELRMGVREVLNDLNAAYPYWEYLKQDRVLDRTANGHHYRMEHTLAQVLGIEIVHPIGDHGTEPPTVLATVSETVGALERYVSGTDEGMARLVADGIRKAMTQPAEE